MRFRVPVWASGESRRRTKPMKNVIRKDEAAVSPVIATILMVAITVVLAAVLYVMVSGLISGPGGTPQSMGISASVSPDGTNWVLLVSSTPTGKAYTTTTLRMVRGLNSANVQTPADASPMNTIHT